MKVDGALVTPVLGDAGRIARALEDMGYDGAFAAEMAHDPFFPLLLGAEATEQIELLTGIAVAFARNPMTTATLANDLHAYSKGRFILGLGSQIKPHITKRFSMEWSSPAARMREFVLAMRAIWATWNDGAALDFQGDFYRHTLMTPFFNPGPNPFGAPKVFLAAVGERMTEVAGEVCDGMILHAFTTERYVREVTMPALERGFAHGDRARGEFELSCPVFVVVGDTEDEIAANSAATKQQIAFYGSTPAYKGVLELHGWTDLHPELHALSKQGEWVEMGRRLDDEVLDAFAVVGTPEDVPKLIGDRYGDILDRVSFYAPYQSAPERWRGVIEELKQI